MTDLTALSRVSAAIGSNRLLVQGAGGNTSVKDHDVLWVKASGCWLAQAMSDPIFVPLDLPRLREALAAGDQACETCVDFVRADLSPPGLRPSIETTLHAGLPQRYVIHIHCIETISHVVLADGRARVTRLLDGLKWQWVPYRRPGLPLFQALEPGADVYALANHGLVVAADELDTAVELAAEVRRRLARPHLGASPQRAASPARSGYRPADAPALAPYAVEKACSGTLYPDHIVFLGSGAADLATAAERAPLILVPDAAPLLRDDLTPAQVAMAQCLADVAVRLASEDEPRYLTEPEEYALTHWDAERYRQTLAGTA